MPESHLRAGDADRAAVATVLGRHMADGRLTVAEYDERVARAYASRTYGELDELTGDLPVIHHGSSVDAAPGNSSAHEHRPPVPACGSVAQRRSGRAETAWGAWRRTAVIVIAIWAITSAAAAQLIYFWPVWVLGPWGAMLLAQTFGGAGRRSRFRQRT